MRITSGKLRNRTFAVPPQEVRPTKERVREAIFSSLGGSCEGLKVLDLFAGSGSLGLEAWSRDAESVTFVEQHAGVFRMLQKNVGALDGAGLGSVECVRSDALKWLTKTVGQFDLILADPPYNLPGAMTQTLEGIVKHSVLTDGGTLVYELRSSDRYEVSDGWRLLRDKSYGDTRVLMLTLNSEERE